eukprot:g3461.t1
MGNAEGNTCSKKLYKIGNDRCEYSGGRLYKIGSDRVEWSSGKLYKIDSSSKLYKIGNDRVEWSGGKLYKIGSDRVEYSGGKWYKIGSKRVESTGTYPHADIYPSVVAYKAKIHFRGRWVWWEKPVEIVPFVTGEKPEGIKIGEKHHHSYGESCFNANKKFIETYAKGRSRVFRKSGPWDETRICVELLADGVINDPEKIKVVDSVTCECYDSSAFLGTAGSCVGGGGKQIKVASAGCDITCGTKEYRNLPSCPPKRSSSATESPGDAFRVACEGVLGIICRRQCSILGQLFEVKDYRSWPPRRVERKTSVTLEECVACLQYSDCTQRPLTFGAEGLGVIDAGPWGG